MTTDILERFCVSFWEAAVAVSTRVQSRVAGFYVFGSGSNHCGDNSGGLATAVGSGRPGVTGIHCFDNLNDGNYGNSYSWIAGATNQVAGIQFPSPRAVAGIALARDKLGHHSDRTGGTVTIQLTSVQGLTYSALVGTADWCSVGAAQTRSGGNSNYFQFSSAITVAALRIMASDSGSCYDELEIFAA